MTDPLVDLVYGYVAYTIDGRFGLTMEDIRHQEKIKRAWAGHVRRIPNWEKNGLMPPNHWATGPL